jgi:hypothetical protein
LQRKKESASLAIAYRYWQMRREDADSGEDDQDDLWWIDGLYRALQEKE